MSATNKTTHYELPSFIASDKPAWLVDWNGAMAAIDAAIYEAKTSADTAGTDVTQIQADLTTLAGTVTTQGTSITTLTTSLSTLTGTVNTITSLIGNGVPTTTDKTIIGAINELHADISGGGTVSIAAADITYDNTVSGLTASNAQSAIDELQSEISAISPVSATSRYIVVADSYGNPVASGNNNFLVQLQSLLDASNDNFYGLYLGSLGFTHLGANSGEDPGMNCLQFLQSQASNISSPSTITDIVITVGLNDIGEDNSANEETNINAVIAYLKSTYPNAKIHYGFIGNALSASTTTAQMVEYYYNTLSLCNTLFREAGCAVMNGIEYVMHDATNMSSDMVHPNSAGNTALANFIYEHLKGLNPKYQHTVHFTNAWNQSCDISIDGPITSVAILGWGTKATGSTGAGGFVDVFDFNGSPIAGIYDRNARVFYPVMFMISGVLNNIQASFGAKKLEIYTASSNAYTGINQTEFTFSTLRV